MRGLSADSQTIRQLRQTRGWTQEQLATAAKCDIRTIRNAEQGKRIAGAILTRIAKTLEVHLVDLLVADIAQQQRNIEIVRKWLQFWVDSDIEGLMELHHPETTLELPGAGVMPGIPETARFHGLNELREHFTYVFSAFAWEEVLEESLDAKGDLVFHRNECRFRGLDTGNVAVTKFYNEFQFEDGLIIRRMTISDLGGRRHVLGME